MFAIDCYAHQSRVLLDWSCVEGVHDSPDGTVIEWRCWCGARGRLVAGLRSEPRRAVPRGTRRADLAVMDDAPIDDVLDDTVASRTAGPDLSGPPRPVVSPAVR